jgi:hypothetical protein
MFNHQLALALAAVATLGIAVTQSAGAMGSHLPKPVNTHPSSLGAMEFHQPKTEIAHPSSLARILARDRMPWGGWRCRARGGTWVYTCVSWAPATQPGQFAGPCVQQGWTCIGPIQ